MRNAIRRTAAVLLTAALSLAACSGAEPSDTPGSTPDGTEGRDPHLRTFDADAAAELYVAWREVVYRLPPTQPETLDVGAAADAIVVPGSQAADWVTQELELARDRGVVVRGTIHVEPISAVRVAGGRATVTICSSADVDVTDVSTGDPVDGGAVDSSYTRFDVAYRRIDGTWLVEQADLSDERDCVPPAVEGSVTARWVVFTEAWYERDRQGGGEALGPLTEVVTDRFARTLRGLPPRDPVPDPDPFTDFELVAATRTSATGHACRSGGSETIEWLLVEGQWRVDFAGQVGQEARPCP